LTRLDDPSLVADEYADDARLRRRAAALGSHFARVTREDIDGRVEFADHAEVEEYVRASISMSPFVANLPATVDEPFFARRANSIFVAEKAS
jgi:hypothetical protein